MAFGPEELERRKQQRQQYEQKRREEQQTLKKRLITAGFALAFTAILILLMVFARPSVQVEPGVTTDPTATGQTRPPETEPPTGQTVIRFTAAGDLNITDKVVQSGGSSLNYTDMISDVLPILADADLTTINLEGNFVGPPYGTATSSAPLQLLQALKMGGVDMIQMANSCAIDNGIIGLETTLKSIRASGLEPLGAYATNAEAEKHGGYTIWDARGVRVAVVAFTKGMGGLGLPAGSEDCVNKLYLDYDTEYKKIDYDGIRKILKNLRSEKPDVTIAMLHWGMEHNDSVFESQQDIAALMFDEGVDVILGTHSHMIHEIVHDKENNTLVAYSLGDFFGDASKAGTNYSLVLDIQITKDNEMGTTKIDGFTTTPIYTLSETENNGYRRVVRIDETIAAYQVNFVDKVTGSAKDSMEYALERIEARIDPAAWKAKQEAQKAAEEAG